jgi:hypothetical protein
MSAGWFVLGALSWSASEYAIHRFVGHGPKRPAVRSLLARLTPAGLAAEFNREHLAHHTDPTYFAPTERKVLAAAAAVPLMTSLLAPVVGIRRAASFGTGFAVAYGAYEVLHRRIHTHPPRGAYGRWLRRHHLLHHYKTPRKNHGVTTAAWDHVFGTVSPNERVRVPQRTAPVWLAGDDGLVRPDLAHDYEIVPSALRGTAERRAAPGTV